MTYALWIGWCALESVDTEIKHVDNWLIDWLIDNQVQFQNVHIQENVKNLPVGGRLRQFLPEWEKQGPHRLIIGLMKDGYKLSFRERNKAIQGTQHNQQLRRLLQTKCLLDLYSRPAGERRNQRYAHPWQSGVLQPSLPGTKTRQPLEASYRLKLTKQIPGYTKIQDGDPRICMCFPQKSGMGHIHRSHRLLPPCTYSHPVSEIPQISFQRRHLPVNQPTVWASNSPSNFHQCSQGSKTDCLTIRNQTSPIPGRLVDLYPPSKQECMEQTQKAGKGFGLYRKPQEVRTPPLKEIRLPGIPIFTRFYSCEALAREVDKTSKRSITSPLSLLSVQGLLCPPLDCLHQRRRL